VNAADTLLFDFIYALSFECVSLKTSGQDCIGGLSGEDPPVPIPNTEVKLPSADGTSRATARESRPLPILSLKHESRFLEVMT
jgi:hypothetical protein